LLFVIAAVRECYIYKYSPYCFVVFVVKTRNVVRHWENKFHS